MKQSNKVYKKVVEESIFRAYLVGTNYPTTDYTIITKNLDVVKELVKENPQLIFNLAALDEIDVFGRDLNIFYKFFKHHHNLISPEIKNDKGQNLYDYYLSFETEHNQLPSLVKSFFIQKGFSSEKIELTPIEEAYPQYYFEHNKAYEYFKEKGLLEYDNLKDMYNAMFTMNFDGAWVDDFNRKSIENNVFCFKYLGFFLICSKIYGVNIDTRKKVSNIMSRIVTREYATYLKGIMERLEEMSKEDIEFLAGIKHIFEITAKNFYDFLPRLQEAKEVEYDYLKEDYMVIKYIYEYKKKAEVLVELPQWIKDIEGEYAGMRFEWVTKVEEINALSCYYSNCMRNYIMETVNQESYLLKIYKGDKLKYCVQVLDNGEIGEKAYKGGDEFRKDYKFIEETIKVAFSAKQRVTSLLKKKDYNKILITSIPILTLTVWLGLEVLTEFPLMKKIASFLFGY